MIESEKLITLEEHNENYKEECAKRKKEEILSYPLSNIKCKSCKEGVYRIIPPEKETNSGTIGYYKSLVCTECEDRSGAYFLE